MHLKFALAFPIVFFLFAACCKDETASAIPTIQFPIDVSALENEANAVFSFPLVLNVITKSSRSSYSTSMTRLPPDRTTHSLYFPVIAEQSIG